MASTAESLAKTFSLLIDITRHKTDDAITKIKAGAWTYTKTLLLFSLTWIVAVPSLIYLKATTGQVGYAYAAALLSAILIIALRALWSPLGILIGMLKGETINPVLAGEGYVRKSASILFVGLMVSLYAAKNPIENNPHAVPGLLMAMALLIIASYVWGSWISGKVYTLALTIFIIYTTLSFYDPNPIGFILSGCQPSPPAYSIYQGQIYGPGETITVTNSGQEFSELVTLNGTYDAEFLLWADFLPEGSNKPIRVKPGQPIDFKFKTFQVRSPLGRVIFRPK